MLLRGGDFANMTYHWGYMAAILSALLYGIGATLNKIVLANVHPTVVAGLIYLFTGKLPKGNRKARD